jgi:translation elongation factor EF-Tu-like GTPase
MPVEDVFSIAGRGTVATGRVETGIVKVNINIYNACLYSIHYLQAVICGLALLPSVSACSCAV